MSPVSIVDKRDNDFRLVVNYRWITEILLGNASTIPNIKNSLATLVNRKFYANTCLNEAFLGAKPAKESIPEIAIIFPCGFNVFLRSNFGL